MINLSNIEKRQRTPKYYNSIKYDINIIIRVDKTFRIDPISDRKL